MKILLLIINVAVLIGSAFFFILGLSGGSASDPVFRGTLLMVITSLIGIIGMALYYKKINKVSYYIFAVVGIGIPVVTFQVLSAYFGN